MRLFQDIYQRLEAIKRRLTPEQLIPTIVIIIPATGERIIRDPAPAVERKERMTEEEIAAALDPNVKRREGFAVDTKPTIYVTIAPAKSKY